MQDISQIMPRVLYCDREKNVRPGSVYGPVIRDVYIFECCVSGYGSVIINGREFPVGPGDCYILLPGDTVIHTADKKNPRDGVWCVASGSMIGQYVERVGINAQQPFAPKEIFHEINEIIEELLAIEEESDTGSELKRTAALYSILSLLYRERQNTSKDMVIQKTIGIMETRYSEQLSTQELALAVGLERSYFSTFFKQKVGMPPHRYLTRLRIQKACKLMEQNDLSISNIAESVGLDAQNFSRIFKRETGLTPLQYKQKL